MKRKHVVKLRQILVKRFDDGELRTLCFDLGVDYDDLRGEGKANKATALVAYCERHERIADLVATGKQLRPEISWPDIPEETAETPSKPRGASELSKEANLRPETQKSKPVQWMKRALRDPALQAIVAVLALLVAIGTWFWPDIRDLISQPAFKGKVCQIKDGWDTNTIFLRQAEFDKLGLPIGTKVTVGVRDTGRSVENVTLSLDSDLRVCSVRLANRLRDPLGVDDDTEIEPESKRPDRRFDITQQSPPTNKETIDFQGKICMIKQDQDTATIFLRQAEFDAFGVPAGTTVSVTVLDTGRTVDKVTLGLDSGLAICTVRLSRSLREALGVAQDTDVQPPESRLDRQFLIRLPQP